MIPNSKASRENVEKFEKEYKIYQKMYFDLGDDTNKVSNVDHDKLYDKLYAVDTNHTTGDIYCVGTSDNQDLDLCETLLLKHNSDMECVVKKRYRYGTTMWIFRALIVDISGNIVCAGYSQTKGGKRKALVVKFAENLDVIQKVQNKINRDSEFTKIETNGLGEIICSGQISTVEFLVNFNGFDFNKYTAYSSKGASLWERILRR